MSGQGNGIVDRAITTLERRENSCCHLVGPNSVHAAKVDRTFTEETRTAFDVMPDNLVTVAEWTGKTVLGRSEHGDHRDA